MINTHDQGADQLQEAGIPLEFTSKAKEDALKLRNRLLGARFTLYDRVPYLTSTTIAPIGTPRDSQIIQGILSVQPEPLQSDLLPVLISRLFSVFSYEFQEEIDVAIAVQTILSVKKDWRNNLPARTLFTEISKCIRRVRKTVYDSKEIGSIVRRMGFDTSRITHGTAIIIRHNREIDRLKSKYMFVESID